MHSAAVAVSLAAILSASAASAIGPFPLESTVNAALASARAMPLSRPTGLSRKDYVALVADVVGHFQQFQDAQGRIIDPYMHEEIQYSTPCYAMGCFLLATEPLGATKPPPIESCAAALNASALELASGVCASNSCNFFTKPVMLALRLAKEHQLVPPATIAEIEASLRRIDPLKDYHGFQEGEA